MRAGLSTIQQTLTPEAATVLKQSMAEAGRRNHGQTTPLHVASTLLASPASFLRQACIRSHPNSSHPLQCRALDLCFSVALDRLPTATATATDPPLSNALTAALKRAQAHQRRGCPEQQQQPLLAVKVELEQLIISILDDPSVSRVMREASFSSPAVKATIEHTLTQSGFPTTTPNRNLYLNPRLQQRNDETPRNLYLNQHPSSNQQRNDDVKRVIDVMTKSKKRNPILVGESEPEAIRKEILRQIEKGEGELKNVEVISIEKEFVSMSDKSLLPTKIKELGELIENRIGSCDRGILIDLADLKWLVEQPIASSVGRESVGEMAKIVANFGKVWLMGTAICETYLRCQVYHPSMETDWDLQAIPITSRTSLPGLFPRVGTNGTFGKSVESLNPLKNFTTIQGRLPENLDPSRRVPCCPKCSNDYEQELAKLTKDSDEVKSNLPQWLQNAKTKDQSQVKDRELVLKQRTQELQKKWRDTCLRLHPSHNQSPMVVPLTGMYKPNIRLRQTQQPRLQPPTSLQETSQLKSNQQLSLEPPRSPVRTELALGPKNVPKQKDLLGCISSEGKFTSVVDTDSFKKLLKGLMKKAWWQPEAASAIATTITQCKADRGCVWLLFAGPDRVGKKKMASVLAEHVCGSNPITIGLGSRHDDETDMGFRGKTVLDRIVEAVRRNPFSVIVLSDIDEADMLVRGSIKRAMERGRLSDSHGREINLGNVVFVVTGNWSTANVNEQSMARSHWQLRLTIGEKGLKKRRANWLSLDLNLSMEAENGSTIEQEEFAVTSVPHELVGPSDGAVVFKPVQLGLVRQEIEKTIKNAFWSVVEEKVPMEVEEAAVDDILSGLWLGGTSLEEWAEQVLIPSFKQVKAQLQSRGEDVVVQLESDRDSVRVAREWLPTKISVGV